MTTDEQWPPARLRLCPATHPRTNGTAPRRLHTIATGTTRALERQGLLTRDDETPALDIEPADDFEQLLGAAIHYRIATGPRAGRKALTLRTVGPSPPPDNPCIAQLSGFSLHAGTVCEAHERDSLERLCRYIARPTLSNERLSVNDRGQVVYRLKHAFRDGTTHEEAQDLVLGCRERQASAGPAMPQPLIATFIGQG